jgi:eukaryotic-like serine/threonine-protein kinase
MVSVGDRLAQFLVTAELGEGGMGKVFRARDESLERDVALKVVHPRLAQDPRYRRRLVQEAKAAAAVNHPNIATVYEVGEAEGTLFIAMEWVDGRTLADRLHEGPLSLEELTGIFRRVANALAKAHDAGVVHRDLKPSNVMLGEGVTKVLDFGIARRETPPTDPSELGDADTSVTAEGAIVGTPGYMSPEQALGQSVDRRSDIFALGVLLYESVSGHRPFGGASLMETLVSVTRDEPPKLFQVPEAMAAIIERCLEKDPAARFQRAEDVAVALDAAHEVEPIRASAVMAETVMAETVMAETVHARRPLADSKSAANRSRFDTRQWIAVASVMLVLGAYVWLSGRRSAPPTVPPASSAQAGSSSQATSSSTPSAIPITALALPTSSHAEALTSYRRGLQAMRQSSWEHAATAFAEAVERDPELAMAHLRLAHASLFSRGASRAQAHLQRAAAGREGMTARQRALFEVLEPVIDGERPDWNKSLARLEQATSVHPNDAELWLLTAGTLIRMGRASEALDPARRAVALDPGYTDALQAEGQALLHRGKVDAAAQTFDRCIASSPATVDCIYNRAFLHDLAGACRPMIDSLRLAMKRGRSDGWTVRRLAGALVSLEGPSAAAKAALDKARSLSAGGEAWRGELDEALWAAAQGDLEGAADAARGVARDDDVSLEALMDATRLRLSIHAETADATAMLVAADDFAARRQVAESASHVDAALDPSMLVAQVRREGHRLSPEQYLERRGRWLETRHRAGMDESALWLGAFALAATTPEQAVAALKARPSIYDGRLHGRLESFDAVDGQVHALADHADAQRLLERASRVCAWLHIPVQHLRALGTLGRLLEEAGDEAGACRAYEVVVRHWGKARPRSLTGAHALARRTALECPATPR